MMKVWERLKHRGYGTEGVWGELSELQPWTQRDWRQLRHNAASVTCYSDIKVRCKRDKHEVKSLTVS